MPETTPQKTNEFVVGSEVPIKEHSGCASLVGIVTALDEKGVPKSAKCKNGRSCRSKTVMVDHAAIRSKMFSMRRNY